MNELIINKYNSRLLESKQYNKVFSFTDVKKSNQHILLLGHKTNLPFARLGLVVAKKKIPLAVNRNRFKRLAKAHFYQNIHKLPSLDIIILTKQDISSLTKTEQNNIFSKVFSKLTQ